MNAVKQHCIAVCVVLFCTIPVVGKVVTYEWKSVQFLGGTYFVPTLGQDGDYHASENYTLRGIWKKLEDGKVVDENVPCTDVNNVCIYDKHNIAGVQNGGLLKWALPYCALPSEFTVASCKSGTHKFKSPDGKKSYDDNQQTKSVKIDRPVPPPEP